MSCNFALRVAVVKKLYEFGILPYPAIDEDTPRFISDLLKFVEDGEEKGVHNLLKFLCFLGNLAHRFEAHLSNPAASQLTEKLINDWMQIAASQAGITSTSLITSTHEQLCYWMRAEEAKSLQYRLSNILVVFGVITLTAGTIGEEANGPVRPTHHIPGVDYNDLATNWED